MLDGFKTIIAAGLALLVEVLSKMGFDVGAAAGVPALTDAIVMLGTFGAMVFRFFATKNLQTGEPLQ